MRAERIMRIVETRAVALLIGSPTSVPRAPSSAAETVLAVASSGTTERPRLTFHGPDAGFLMHLIADAAAVAPPPSENAAASPQGRTAAAYASVRRSDQSPVRTHHLSLTV